MSNREKKKLFNKYKIYVFTILCSTILIGLIYFFKGVSPLGKNGLLDIDFFHQYCPLLYELHHRIKTLTFTSYSFTMGLGLPFMRNFLTYLASPLNLIMIFFSQKNLILSFSIIIALKLILTSISFVYYMNCKYQKQKYYFIPLGLAYAFSGYFAAYYWNIMWFDGILFLPLVVLGIERLVDKGKWKFFTITLSLAIFTNYYIGYVICLFSCIYFVIYTIYKKKKNIKLYFNTGCLYAFSIILAGLLLSCVLVPQYLALSSISATKDLMPTTMYYEFSVIELIQKFFCAVPTTVLSSGITCAPNIYVGTIIIPLLILFFINSQIEKRKKIFYFILLFFTTLPFFIPQLDFIFHAFHIPNDLPYRYSFIYNFVLLIISAESLNNIRKIKLLEAIITMSIIIAYLIVLLIIPKISIISVRNIYINIGLIVLYFICYLMIKYIKFRKIIIIVTILVMTELFYNIYDNWNVNQSIEYFNDYISDTSNKIEKIKSNDKTDFYRIETIDQLTYNDPSLLNYYGYNSYTSMNYYSTSKLQYELGAKGNEINSNVYIEQTPIFDLINNIKYVIGNRISDLDDYEEVETDILKFKYNNGLLFGVSPNIMKWNTSSENSFEVQNSYMEQATGILPLKKIDYYNLEVIDKNNGTITVKYNFDSEIDNVYGYFSDKNINFIVVNDALYYKDDKAKKLAKNIDYSISKDYEETYIIDIGKSEDMYINYNEEANIDNLMLYYLNNKEFVEAYKILNKYRVRIDEFKESNIKGNFDFDQDRIIYTSIPYDPGWKVYIDGNRVKTRALAKSYLVFNGPKGKHKVELKYQAKGSLIGLLLSFLALILLLLYDKIITVIKRVLGDKNDNRHHSSSL